MASDSHKQREEWRTLSTPRGESVLQELGLRAPDLLAASLGRVVRATPLRQTRRIPLPRGDSCFLKQYAPGAGRAGRITWLRAPARAEWQALDELAHAGLAVPDLLAAVWHRRGDGARSAILMASAPGEPLDVLLARGIDRDGRAWLLRELPAFVARLHRAGFWHRDLYAAHLLVDADWRSPPTLIDVARVRRTRRLSRRRRVKDLAALCYSLQPRLSRGLLLRLLCAYLGKPGLDTAGKRLVRSIARKVRRIARHRPLYG